MDLCELRPKPPPLLREVEGYFPQDGSACQSRKLRLGEGWEMAVVKENNRS